MTCPHIYYWKEITEEEFAKGVAKIAREEPGVLKSNWPARVRTSPNVIKIDLMAPGHIYQDFRLIIPVAGGRTKYWGHHYGFYVSYGCKQCKQNGTREGEAIMDIPLPETTCNPPA